MRALILGLLLLTSACHLALAQTKQAAKPSGNETRYFTAVDGFMDGADVILKETRQGKAVSAAVLDVCYAPDKGSERKDRFIANLAVSGQNLSGTAQSLGDKTPVTVRLTRRPTADTFEFKGQVVIGTAVSEISSSDNSDLSEKEFQDNQSTDDSIAPAPKDFTEVSPEAVGVKLKLDAASEFLKSLRGQNVEISLGSLGVTCDVLRAGEMTVTLAIDPDRAAAFVAKARMQPGVLLAGWTSGVLDMDRTIRFPAADWRDGDQLNRDRIAATLGTVLSRTLSAKLSSSSWSDDTGKLKMVFKHPSAAFPELQLTEALEVTALAAPDKPGATDRMILWVSSPTATTADESSGPRLNVKNDSGSDEEAEPREDGGSIDALAKEFKAQRWDSDKAAWK